MPEPEWQFPSSDPETAYVCVTCGCEFSQRYRGTECSDCRGQLIDRAGRTSTPSEPDAPQASAEADLVPEYSEEQLAQVIVTTTPGIDGARVKEYLGVESVEIVMGTGLFSELTSGVADAFGRRSRAFEKKMADAKRAAERALKVYALDRGGNAVIGADLNYADFGGNRIAIVISGTVVVLEPTKTRAEAK